MFPIKLKKCLHSLHDSHGVIKAALLLLGTPDTHGGLQQDVNGHAGHVVVAVELLADLASKSVHQVNAVFVEKRHERFQDVQVEGRGYYLAVASPLLARAYQKTFAQPWCEKPNFQGCSKLRVCFIFDW